MGTGRAVRMVLDFGNPDLFISTLDFDGTVSGNSLSCSLSGELVQSGQASATKQ